MQSFYTDRKIRINVGNTTPFSPLTKQSLYSLYNMVIILPPETSSVLKNISIQILIETSFKTVKYNLITWHLLVANNTNIRHKKGTKQ